MQTAKSTPELYTALFAHTHALLGRGDQAKEAHLSCPECGHLSTPKSPHCSFSPRGWKCFVCGCGGSLQDLANRVGLEKGTYIPPILAEAPVRHLDTPSWMQMDVALPHLRRWEHHPERFQLWQAYKPLPAEVITAARLGVGKLPAFSSKCTGDRLIVPVLDVHGQLVGIRGRYLHCLCCDPKKDKWLVAKGTTPERMPLYNAEALTPGCVVYLVENPIDALLVAQATSTLDRPFIGVAAYSTSYWHARWTRTLQAAQPEFVIVAFDNDLVGNGGAARRNELINGWKASHHTDKIPSSRGVKLVNHLIASGINAALFDWAYAPPKADVGSLLMA